MPGEAISNRRFIDSLVLKRLPYRVLETLVTIKGRWYRGTAFLPDLVNPLTPSAIIFMQASTTPLVPFTPFAPFAFFPVSRISINNTHPLLSSSHISISNTYP